MNRLKEIREDRDMTQDEVGALLGVSKMSISRYERGGASIPNDLIGQLCGIFDVTADYLLGLSTWRAPVVSNSDTEILAAYHAAPADIRAIIDTALAPYKEDAGAGAAAS